MDFFTAIQTLFDSKHVILLTRCTLRAKFIPPFGKVVISSIRSEKNGQQLEESVTYSTIDDSQTDSNQDQTEVYLA